MKLRVFIISVLAVGIFVVGFVLATCATGNATQKTLDIYPLKAPEAGNYPQSLFKYPFKEKGVGDNITYAQTIEWSPAVSKTFAANTQYTAIITLEPKFSPGLFKAKADYSFNGLPESGVKSVSTKVKDTNLEVKVVFEKTAKENVPAQILFEDDFEGTTLDTAKWDINTNENRQGRSKWMKEMTSVGEGKLRLKLQRDDSLGKDWIRAGAVQTRKVQPSYRGAALFENSYGYYEASIKFPPVRGTWGAFWMFGPTVGTIGNGGIDGTEIDIIESIWNNQGKYNSALHWDGYGKEHQSVGSPEGRWEADIYDGEFHTFALDWSPSEYVFYVDNKEFWRMDGSRLNNSGIAQNPNFLIFSVEGADWAGPLPADFTEDEMLVDWVKVWNQPRN